MSSVEMDQVVEVVTALWPKALPEASDEKLASWRRVLDRFKPGECISALRGWADSSRFTPHPSEIAETVMKQREQRNRVAPGNPASAADHHDSQRALWARRDPANALVYRNLSDDEVDLRCFAWEFQQSAGLYGSTALATIRAWQVWQSKLFSLGRRDTLVQTPHHTEAARQQFSADPTGEANARQLREQRKRRLAGAA